MGIQCRIIRDKAGKVSYVEAPNGNRSDLYDDAVARVGEDAALDIVLTAYTPSFIEEVKNPKIAAFRKELIDRINSIPSTTGTVTVDLEGMNYVINPSTIQMITEDLGNGETLISFQADLEVPTPQTDIRFSISDIDLDASEYEIIDYDSEYEAWLVETPIGVLEVYADESATEEEVLQMARESAAEAIEEYEISMQPIVYRGIVGEFSDKYKGVQYFAADREYAGVWGKNIETFRLNNKEVLDLDEWNEKWGFQSDMWGQGYLTVHSDNLDNPSEYRERIYHKLLNKFDTNEEALAEANAFMKEFMNAKVITGEDIGNRGRKVYAVRDKSVVTPLNRNIKFAKGAKKAQPTNLIEGIVEKLKRTGLASDVKIVDTKGIREVLTEKGQASKFNRNINGFVLDDIVYINSDNAGVDTPIHEFGHLWNSWAKENTEHLYTRGLELIEQEGQAYIDFVKEQQPDLKGEALLEEALAQAIGDSGARITESKEKSNFLDWLKALWKAIALKTGILAHDVNRNVGNLNLQEFADAVAIDLLKGNKTFSQPLPVIPVTDVSAYPRARVNKEGHNLSFVTKDDIIDIDKFLKEASDNNARVSFWMGDQLGRGTYTDSVTGQKHYLDAGLSYALDPINRSRGVVWASGAVKKTLQRLVDSSDYIIIMSGSPTSAKLFNKAVFDVFSARVGDFTTFKAETLPVATKPWREAIEKHDSWESLRDSTDRKKLLIETIAANETKSSPLKEVLEKRNAFIDYNSMRDGFLADNGFDINEMMLVLKPTGIGKKSTHSTYGWEVEGEVIGVPDRRVNAFDVLERNRREYAGELKPAAQQQVIAPFGIGTDRRIQFSKRNPEQAESKTIQYLDRIEREARENPNQYWSVDIPSRDEVYEAAVNDRIVDTNGGMAIVTEEGDIKGVFKYFHNAKGVVDSVLKEAIAKGGIKLDNFDTYLTKLYERNGFRVVSRLPFNEELAPDAWNKEIHGTPDVVFMVHDPANDLDVKVKTFSKYGLNEAIDYRDDYVRKGLELNKTGQTQGFFSDVVTGKSDKFKAKKEWTPILPFSTREEGFKKIYDKFKGNFDNHIATSIPTFRETQIKVGSAIKSLLAPAPTVFNKPLNNIRDRYVSDKSLTKKDPIYTAIDDSLFTEIAEHHAKIKDDRKNPTMVKSYRAFLNETKDQYQYLVDAGYTIEPWMGEGEPYGVDSQAVRDDVINNKHLYYLRSKSATGDNSDADTADTYMPFESSGITINGDDVLMNDLFRAVHDIFGHVSANNSFSPQGELNAYKTHSVMYSDTAQKALFLETVVYNAAYRETGNYAPRKIYNIPTKFIEGINRKPLVYDIGGSEGGFVKAITEQSNGAVESVNLDLNTDMQAAHNKVPVKGSEFVLEAFYEGYTDDSTGVTYKRHRPEKKADVVHESMVFQFISPKRKEFIKEVKKNYLREDGIALFEEKLSTEDEAVWLENERVKNTYKSQYYSQEELTQKQEEVLVGMKDNQTFREEFMKNLKDEFTYVEEYWDAGNFKGYLATNSKTKRDSFLAKIGGRIASQYSENKSAPKFSIGFMQTQDTPTGRQVKLSNVDDRVQGKGLGTEMYKKAAIQSVEDGKPLMSDFNSKGASGIWNKMLGAGVAEQLMIENGNYVSKIQEVPAQSFDRNSEPRVDDVIQFIQSKNYQGQTLTPEESSDVRNVMLGTSFKDSEELFKALQRAFTPQGIYNPSESSLMASGLYSRAEARRVLDSMERQLAAYDVMQKLRNTDTIVNDLDANPSFVTLTPSYTKLGTIRKANPYLNRKEAINKLGGIKDETRFANEVEANDLTFARKMFTELSKYSKVKVATLDGGLRQSTTIDDLRTRMEETLTSPSNNQIVESLNYVLDIPNEVWNLEFNNVRVLLNEVEKDAIDMGLDLSNLAEEAYDKVPTEVKSLLSAVRNFAVMQNETTFELLLNEYVNYFNISELPNTRNVKLDERTASKTIVFLDTNETPYTLFSEHGLLPLGNNLYQKVNNSKSLQEVYDIVYKTIFTRPSVLPRSAFKADYNIADPANEEFVRRDIANFASEQSKLIDNYKDHDTDILKKMVLFSNFFGTKLQNTKPSPSVVNETDLMINFPQNADYLTTEFVADFNKDLIKEKRKNSAKYRDFYSNFAISNKGIELVNNDPITMSNIRPYLTDNLKNHFRLKKESLNFEGTNEGIIEGTPDAVLRNYYSNYPQTLPKFTGIYHMDNGNLVTNTTKDFIRVDEGVFEYVETVGNKALYGRIFTNDSNFKDYSSMEAPTLGDISKFNITKGVDANKKVSHLYSDAQNTQITNEIDNC